MLLIVDDQSNARLALRFIFESRFEIIEAERAPEALSIIRENQGKIVAGIFDLKLAGASGVDLLREARTIDPRLQIIILTGYETVAASKAAMRYGAIDFLTKPPDIPAITDAVQRACQAHQAAKDQLQKEKSIGDIIALVGAGGAERIRIWQEASQTLGILVTLFRFELELIGGPAGGGCASPEQISADLAIARRHAGFIQQCWRWGLVGSDAGRAAEVPSVHELAVQAVGLLKFHPDVIRREIVVTGQPGRANVDSNPMLIVALLLRLLLDGVQRGATKVALAVSERSAQELRQACPPEGIVVDLQPDVIKQNLPLTVLTLVENGPAVSVPRYAAPATACSEQGEPLLWAASKLREFPGLLSVSSGLAGGNEIILAF